jgi:hypothetical protein
MNLSFRCRDAASRVWVRQRRWTRHLRRCKQETRQAASLQWIFFEAEVCRPATKFGPSRFSPQQRAKHRLISPLDPVPDTISVSAQH